MTGDTFKLRSRLEGCASGALGWAPATIKGHLANLLADAAGSLTEVAAIDTGPVLDEAGGATALRDSVVVLEGTWLQTKSLGVTG